MSAVDVEFHVDPIEHVLVGMAQNSANINTQFIALELQTQIDDVIRSAGRDGSEGGWKRRKSSTIKRMQGKKGKPLQRTGLLANIQTQHGPNFALAYSPAPYAKWHITGTKHMPRRNFLAVDLDKVLDAISDEFLAEIVKG